MNLLCVFGAFVVCRRLNASLRGTVQPSRADSSRLIHILSGCEAFQSADVFELSGLSRTVTVSAAFPKLPFDPYLPLRQPVDETVSVFCFSANQSIFSLRC